MRTDAPATVQDIALTSAYVAMRDGVRIAVDTWRPAQCGPRRPAILVLTRYWRGYALADGALEKQKFFREANHFVRHGFAFICADARGSGASYGSREMELGPREIGDMGELCAWAAAQPWTMS